MTRPIAQVKVLIVERAPTIAALIASTLRNHGYAIAGIVNSGERALQFATATSPDIVLVDIELSGRMDGIMTAWKIGCECLCPVIYMTTHKNDATLIESQSPKPGGYLLKPFTSEELRQSIQIALHQGLSAASQTEPSPDDVLPFDAWDSGFINLLAAISQIQPMPRVLFEKGMLNIYTNRLDEAQLVNDFCWAIAPSFIHQIFTWNSQLQQYHRYAED
jgi:CheY-like chemotaxis protein